MRAVRPQISFVGTKPLPTEPIHCLFMPHYKTCCLCAGRFPKLPPYLIKYKRDGYFLGNICIGLTVKVETAEMRVCKRCYNKVYGLVR